MSHSIKQLSRAGLVVAVAIVTTAVLTLPAAGSSASPNPPSPRWGLGMAYDAARRQVVLFGGQGEGPNCPLYGSCGDTWTWNGKTWTQLSPLHSPSPRYEETMAYDEAHRRIVLYGGVSGRAGQDDTWLWDGTDWTERRISGQRPTGYDMARTYDSANGNVVVFDDQQRTWIWDGDGKRWTEIGTAHAPSQRAFAAMAYDPALGTIVLFGGRAYGSGDDLADTWTWDGTDWTQVSTAHSPSPRELTSMVYDATMGQIVLFGGQSYPGCVGDTGVYGFCNDTWTWNGSDWTRLAPTHSPPPRTAAGMAYDAPRGRLVLFGGEFNGPSLGDTWVWDGHDWSLPAESVALSPSQGPPETIVQVTGLGFAANEVVRLNFIDSTNGRSFLAKVAANASGAFSTQVTIPVGASVGEQRIRAKGSVSGQIVRQAFSVT